MAAAQEVIELANKLAKLSYFAEFDSEAALGAFKEKVAPAGPLITKAQLKQIFLAANYDKVLESAAPAAAEGGAEEEKKAEEGGEEAPAPPAAAEPGKTTDNAEQTFDLLSNGAETIHIVAALGKLHVCKAGYGEAALRFALKAAASDETNSLKESAVFEAIRTTCNRPYSELTPVMRNHLRRAWRVAEKFQPPAPEAPEGAEEGAEPPAAPVVAPEDQAVLVDDFVGKIQEDEVLASLLTKEVAVPIEQPPPPAEAAEE